MNHIQELFVKLGRQEVGSLWQEGHQIYFTYTPSWLVNGFNLSPLTMTFDERPQLPKDIRVFEGLHGAFADSLPDGWGMILMDRFFQDELGISRHEITPLDRLSYMGSRSMGALDYSPKTAIPLSENSLNIAKLYETSVQVQQGDTNAVLIALRIAGGSPGGARPKAAIALSKDLKNAANSFDVLPEDYEHWIVKFRILTEPRSSGAIEQAYALIAKRSGVLMPETALLDVQTSQGNERFFATKRFDRIGDSKVHMSSVAGLLYANFRLPCMDYEELLRLTWSMTRNAVEVEKMARLMVFNALTHNYDDHVKNFAFLHHDGVWSLAPAYDLTFCSTMAEHSTSFKGKGIPTKESIVAICSQFNFLKPIRYIEQTKEAIASWKEVLKELDVNPKEGEEIFSVLEKIIKKF